MSEKSGHKSFAGALLKELVTFSENSARAQQGGLVNKIKRKAGVGKDIAGGLTHEITRKLVRIESFLADLEKSYYLLNDDLSRDLWIKLIWFRLDKGENLRLPLDTKDREAAIERIGGMAMEGEELRTGFMDLVLKPYDLRKADYEVEVLGTPEGLYIIFDDQQYAYETDQAKIGAEPGDVVMDLGGCWGDSALYFASRAGSEGKVFAFEFVPSNIEIFEKNKGLNPSLAPIIELVPHPVWSERDKKMYFNDLGPASSVDFEPFEGHVGETTTVSIDSLVRDKQLSSVDFIKMDIEGAEMPALQGAVETIKKHKPKLAISIYHSWDQFSQVIPWLDALNLGYRFYLGHYTTTHWETVVYAMPEQRDQ